MKKPAVDNSVPFTVPLIEEARPADFGAVSELLAANKLPVEDLLPALPHFFVVKEKRRVIAAIGMEVY
ncbi:MAG TPA: hypothetical protein VL307_13745 [Chitinophagaceae bacterium]|nr:hypothetical protein [Chitinophagaceae bacterium]